MEHKAWAGEIKAVAGSNGGFEGYASLFGIRDEGGDVVEQGAFVGTLASFIQDGFIADGHNWNSTVAGAIGFVVDAREDAHGLWLKTEYHSTPAAQDARTIAQERMTRGKSVGLSIGYAIEPGGAASGQDGTRLLRRLKLYEVSQVNVPMLRPAGLTAVKGVTASQETHLRAIFEANAAELAALQAVQHVERQRRDLLYVRPPGPGEAAYAEKSYVNPEWRRLGAHWVEHAADLLDIEAPRIGWFADLPPSEDFTYAKAGYRVFLAKPDLIGLVRGSQPDTVLLNVDVSLPELIDSAFHETKHVRQYLDGRWFHDQDDWCERDARDWARSHAPTHCADCSECHDLF